MAGGQVLQLGGGGFDGGIVGKEGGEPAVGRVGFGTGEARRVGPSPAAGEGIAGGVEEGGEEGMGRDLTPEFVCQTPPFPFGWRGGQRGAAEGGHGGCEAGQARAVFGAVEDGKPTGVEGVWPGWGEDGDEFLGGEGFECESGGVMPETRVIPQGERNLTIFPVFSKRGQFQEQMPGVGGGQPQAGDMPGREEGRRVFLEFPGVDLAGGRTRAGAGGGEAERDRPFSPFQPRANSSSRKGG